jgi:hypothetical protein
MRTNEIRFGLVTSITIFLSAVTPSALAALPDAARFGVTIEIGNVDAAQRWLDEGLDPDFIADRIGTGLMIGAWEGNIPMMELFLQRGANINALNRQGEQALQLAAWQGQLAAVKWLLDHSADVNRRNDAWSALHYAVFAGKTAVAKLLIERGGDVNARAPNGSTVLMMAAHEGHEDLVQPLLDAGADPLARNEQGDTALSWAMRYGNFSIAERVSKRDEFAAAARAPSSSWGPATRSVSAPGKIPELLRRIRLLEASGQSSEKLRQSLHAAIEEFKKGSQRITIADQTLPPRALLITAKRQKPGQEKAELIVDNSSQTVAPATAGTPPRSRVADILYQLRKAEAEGKQTDALRQELLDAVSSMQR